MLKSGAEQLGIILNAHQLSQFAQYYDLLSEYNRRFNLTRIIQKNDVIIKHFLDSLTAAAYIPQNAKVADVGTGAGFPGIPLKIARPDIELTLIDSLKKRVDFLEIVSEALFSSSIRCVHARAEDIGKLPEYREGFDVSLSRAVSKMNIIAEYSLPLVKIGGYMLAMKGRDIEGELRDSQDTITALGGETASSVLHTLPHSEITHSVIIIHKKRKTPARFPRNNKHIGKPI
ncbi:MAG: 16S rRNA (guanine(527)-N(7))-methyltransferase RsmG [Clostridiales bacterium]|jgi:16S rRNA (guanine527-N7)-methyltransferase|nr:16S rRNA (guanine(527)-N(7))-methyltransferase RsmG [Clostridiales bacterium]